MRSGGDRMADIVPGKGGGSPRRFSDLLDHYDDIVAREESDFQEELPSIWGNFPLPFIIYKWY